MSAFPPPEIAERLRALGCDPARVEESFVHSGGAGGQNVNKVATCVQLRYAPLRLAVKMQEHRTQASNRLAAWRLLLWQLRTLRERQAQERRSVREAERRRRAPRPRGIRKQFVELKRRQAKRRADRSGAAAED